MLRNIGPGTHARDASHNRINVATVFAQAQDLLTQILVAQDTRFGKLDKDLAQEPRMFIDHELSVVRDLANLPKQAKPVFVRSQRKDLLLFEQKPQYLGVHGLRRQHESSVTRSFSQRANQSPR